MFGTSMADTIAKVVSIIGTGFSIGVSIVADSDCEHPMSRGVTTA